MSGETGETNVVQAVVFDLDGVLVASEGLWDEVRRGLAAESDRVWPADATRVMQGMSTAEWSAYLTGVVGVPGRPEGVAAAVIARMRDRYRSRLPLLPGAAEVVQRLGSHWPLGLASSSPRLLIVAVLQSAGLTRWFPVSVSTEEVEAGKPSPAVYREAVRRLGVDAQRVVAVEDSSNGLRSAARAGLAVIAVPNAAFPPAEDALALAAAVVHSLDEISPGLVVSLRRPPAGSALTGHPLVPGARRRRAPCTTAPLKADRPESEAPEGRPARCRAPARC